MDIGRHGRPTSFHWRHCPYWAKPLAEAEPLVLSGELAFYVAIGFAAQLVDGALGMAYGLIATSVLLAFGAPPTIASASVHTAETVTTGLAGASHMWHQNVDWRMVRRLAPLA
jgi:uncharacterized membrane protein YfcA